ncbi:hypothetical protein VBS75_15740 [Klebsiella pneumoniae]|nr:hypothetical protein [Klebsiella pneumoniae]
MSILTKEGIQKILNDDWLLMDECEGLENCTVIKELARMALAAMDSEPVEENLRIADALEGLLWPNMALGNKAVIQAAIKALRTKHAQPAPVLPEIDRRAIADKVYGKCCRIPGATFYNAAEFAIDEVEACRAAMLQAGNSPVIPDGYVMVPKVASQAHLNSIAMRYRHDFYLLNDAQKDSALTTARQMYEECSGQGFYTLPAAPQEVK